MYLERFFLLLSMSKVIDTFLKFVKCILTSRGKNPMPTIKLAAQFTVTATEVATGLAACENNSVTINHGIEPGPVEKKSTNSNTATMDRYEMYATP